MRLKQWLIKQFTGSSVDSENTQTLPDWKQAERIHKDDLSEPFNTFFVKVQSGEIKWETYADERVDGRKHYVFTTDNGFTVRFIRARQAQYSSMYQMPEMFNFRELYVLNKYIEWYEYNETLLEQQKEMQIERDKLSVALGLKQPIDKQET